MHFLNVWIKSVDAPPRPAPGAHASTCPCYDNEYDRFKIYSTLQQMRDVGWLPFEV